MSPCVARISYVLCFLTIFSALFFSSPAQAAPTTVQPYKIVGTDIQVTPAGTPLNNPYSSVCILRGLDVKTLQTVGKAGKAKGDANSAPFAISADGKTRQYFDSPDCKDFFEELALRGSTKPSEEIVCNYLPPAYREECLSGQRVINDKVAYKGGQLYGGVGQAPLNETLADNKISQEENEKIKKKKADKADAERQCFEGTMDRIGQYWVKQQGVECVKVATRFITKNIKKQIAAELKHMELNSSTNLKSVSQGSSPGAILSLPDTLGVVMLVKTVLRYGMAVAKVAANNAADLDFLLNDCLKLSDKFGDLKTWKKGVLNGLCKQVESLVERQLTQCIRVNVAFDLSLPQFSVMLQCPVNINVAASIGPQGARFDASCIKNSPISASASWGGQSLLSTSGGLENLFSGDCFKPASTTGGVNGGGATASTSTPGVDCGPLNTAPVRSENLQGQIALAAGSAVANGWVAGRSETVTSPSGIAQLITRCDFFRDSRNERTVYVYGSGSSCSTSSTGFTDNGFETNTSCYAGGYTPRINGDTIPDACLYPVDCLNTEYAFDSARRGVGNCTANVQPLLDTTRRYPISMSSGGVGDSATEWRSCADFSSIAEQAPVCCDPQKQDCREARSKNIPICQCDQGDSSNTVIDVATGKCDPNKGGGMRTCCTASLNGGTAGCTTQVGMAASQVCANGDQCVGSGEVAGVDASGNPVTAGQANTAKPSPFSYLAIRPDVKLTGITNADGSPKQCCTTPWCNICPQHYANAYGMAMARADWNATPPSATASLVAVRNYNDAIVGKGWPFTTSTNAQGETTYQIGINPITVTLQIGLTIVADQEQDVQVNHPMLHMSDKLEQKLSSTQFDSCKDINGWQIGYTAADNFGTTGGNSLGYVYDRLMDLPRDKKQFWTLFSGLPEAREMPMDYLNRLQANKVDDNGVPVEPIELCSEVIKICAPGTTSGGVTGSTTGGVGGTTGNTGGAVVQGGRAITGSTATSTGASAPTTAAVAATPTSTGERAAPTSATTTTQQQTPSTTTSTTTTTGGRTSAPAATSTGPTVVPSANPNATGSIF